MKQILLILFLLISTQLVSCTTVNQVSDEQQALMDIQEPHQPDYGDSPYKDKMVTAAINYLEKFIIDMKSGEQAKEWDHVQGYLVNFHEYDETANAWFIKSNGEAVYVPFLFIENNGTITVDGITGYSVKKMMDKTPDDPDRVMFERQIHDAVKQLSDSLNESDSHKVQRHTAITGSSP